ncbi:hypothetical protein HMSSN036_83830 [Paenibacillus macerans]|nr:hypothetical protein HMSSN036_83830 [Paenibacillus macerans]
MHAQVKANYLASPPLVVAYALAGTVNIDLQNDPIGYDGNNQPVYLKDIWPSSAEIKEAIAASLSPDMFRRKYEHVFTQNERWNAIPVPQGELYEWDENRRISRTRRSSRRSAKACPISPIFAVRAYWPCSAIP